MVKSGWIVASGGTVEGQCKCEWIILEFNLSSVYFSISKTLRQYQDNENNTIFIIINISQLQNDSNKQ